MISVSTSITFFSLGCGIIHKKETAGDSNTELVFFTVSSDKLQRCAEHTGFQSGMSGGQQCIEGGDHEQREECSDRHTDAECEADGEPAGCAGAAGSDQ